ncbi:DUF4328 domain-containing protein [Streptomyces sp. NPDC005931]|uniref:DUF4328 domain-containing protein n=1 Tax=Streptomyces sp. NPDC005931 TaxID=3364737 RepID=UPI0036C82355
MLACFALVTVATDVAGWHKYQVLLAPPLNGPDEGEELVSADMWFGNLTGWWQAAFLATMLLFLVWLDNVRTLADTLWPEGQRHHRAWVLFGWLVPLAQLFVPKMFINDVWAAAQPARRRRRGNPLLTMWWLTVLAAGAWATDGYSALKQAATAGEARQALRHVMLSDGLRIGAAALTIAVVWRLSGSLHQARDGEASADAHVARRAPRACPNGGTSGRSTTPPTAEAPD